MKKRKILKFVILPVLALILLSFISFGVYSVAFAQKFYHNQNLAGINLSGKTKLQAQNLLDQKTKDFLKNPIVLNFQKSGQKDQTFQINSVDINLKFDTAKSVDAAWNYGRGNGAFEDFWQQLKSIFAKNNVVPSYSLDSNILNQKIADIAKQTDVPEKDYSLVYAAGKFSLSTDRKAGERVNQPELISSIKSQISNAQAGKIDFQTQAFAPKVSLAKAQATFNEANQMLQNGSLTFTFQNQSFVANVDTIAGFIGTKIDGDNLKIIFADDQLNSFVGDIAKNIDIVPKDATLGVVNGAVVATAPETVGQALDQSQTKTDIEGVLTSRLSNSNISATISLKVDPAAPQISQSSISSLGLKDLIGTGTTNFSGSSANRVANIKTGVTAINGQLVQPGAEFSTIAALGPIDQAHGYVPGLVIVNNQTLPEDGGGLCQVSTTLFRSVLNAGLPVTARTPHSYEVSYYQRGVGPGLDATIFDPKPDFKWVNDTGHVIFIQGIVSGTSVTFNLFGTSDGRTAVITGPTTLSTSQPSGAPIYVTTNTLAPGVSQLIDPPVPGAKTTATYTVTRNGIVINKQVFNSNYQAMPAQYLIGPTPTPTPAPAVTPTPTPTVVAPTSTCSDGIQNGDETGVDCGGSCPNACATPPAN